MAIAGPTTEVALAFLCVCGAGCLMVQQKIGGSNSGLSNCVAESFGKTLNPQCPQCEGLFGTD